MEYLKKKNDNLAIYDCLDVIYQEEPVENYSKNW